MRPVSRTEQLIRSLILLAACAVFSLVAYWAGAPTTWRTRNGPMPAWPGVVAAAALVSRLGTKIDHAADGRFLARGIRTLTGRLLRCRCSERRSRLKLVQDARWR